MDLACNNPESSPSPVSQSDTDSMVGRMIDGRFRVLSLIAEGGMGRVYKAEQLPVGRVVALKILAFGQGLVGSSVGNSAAAINASQFQQRFLLEASICAKLTHPNTVTLFDYGRTSDGVYYIAMELIKGRSLSAALRQDGPLEPARALSIARQVACSLREAHRLGVIHRDIKPGNILLTHHDDNADFVKVLDFGLVKPVTDDVGSVTEAGLFLGTPRYMSPEQVRGGSLDARSDVYSLGVLLYEMLCGLAPFVGSSAMDTAAAHLVENPPTLSKRNPAVNVPKALCDVVMCCLAKAPEDRFESMDGLLAGFAQAAELARLSLPMTTASAPEYEPATLATARDDEVSLESEWDSPPAAPNRRMLFAGVALLGVGFVGALLWLKSPFLENFFSTEAVRAEPPPRMQSGKNPEPTPVRLPPVDITEPKVATRPTPTALSLRSQPSGAKVTLDGDTVCQATPCQLQLNAPADKKGREVTFRFSRSGYESQSVKRKFQSGSLRVAATLKRSVSASKAGGRNRTSASSARKKSKKQRQPDNGYKSNPY